MIPYGRQTIERDDIKAVIEVLQSDWLTTGPKVTEFEKAVCGYVGARHGVAVSSGTAALHCAMFALGIGPGDEVIVPAMTFVATANSVVYQGGTPVFADVEPDTLLIDPVEVAKRITAKTKAIIAVDYAGQPCRYEQLRVISDKYHLKLVADGCHALGGEYKGGKVGSLADMTVFSFHPVKHITTGEGGMITTDDGDLADRMRIFRNHGIISDPRKRMEQGSWFYEMTDIGFNYRITDIQCGLGISQLKKLPAWIKRRQELAAKYDAAFMGLSGVKPLVTRSDVLHAFHLYVVRFDRSNDRNKAFNELRARGISSNVHYIPVYEHPFYVNKFGKRSGLCPVTEQAYEGILSLPMFPTMPDTVVDQVVGTILGIC